MDDLVANMPPLACANVQGDWTRFRIWAQPSDKQKPRQLLVDVRSSTRAEVGEEALKEYLDLDEAVARAAVEVKLDSR